MTQQLPHEIMKPVRSFRILRIQKAALDTLLATAEGALRCTTVVRAKLGTRIRSHTSGWAHWQGSSAEHDADDQATRVLPPTRRALLDVEWMRPGSKAFREREG